MKKLKYYKIAIFNFENEKTYEEYRSRSDDSDIFFPLYSSWKKKRNEYLEKNDDVLLVTVDPDIFFSWCKNKGIKSDSHARARYADEIFGKNPDFDQSLFDEIQELKSKNFPSYP